VHDNKVEHGKGAIQRTATRSARQRGGRAHGNEQKHDKERIQRTAKNEARQRPATAHCKEHSHGKDAFAVWQPFAVGKQAFSFFSFLFYSFYYLCLFLN
jgi:hypothetical protein